LGWWKVKGACGRGIYDNMKLGYPATLFSFGAEPAYRFGSSSALT
jgi:hypothetical protein